MTTKMKQSRQMRALAQRGDEFGLWTAGDERAVSMSERCRNYGKECTDRSQANEKKAAIASRDVTALKTKLGRMKADEA